MRWSSVRSGVSAFLLGTQLPVWATLLGVVFGILGTYYLLPVINQTFERQKIKTEFILRSLDDLNAKTRSLVSDIATLNRRTVITNKIDQDAVDRVMPKIADLQWKAIELSVVFEGTSSQKTVERYQRALDDLRSGLLEQREDIFAGELSKRLEQFAAASLDVLREVALLSGINLKANVPAVR